MTSDRRTGAAAQPGSARRPRIIGMPRMAGQATAAPLPDAGRGEAAEGVVLEGVILAGARSPPCRDVFETPIAAPERVDAGFAVAPPAENAPHGAIPRTAVRRPTLRSPGQDTPGARASSRPCRRRLNRHTGLKPVPLAQQAGRTLARRTSRAPAQIAP